MPAYERYYRGENTQQEHYGVLDDKIAGRVVSLGSRYKHLETQVKAMGHTMTENTPVLEQLVVQIAEENNYAKVKSDSLVNKDKAKDVKRAMSRSLDKALGHKRAEKISDKFVEAVEKYGLEKGAKLLVKNFEKVSRKGVTRTRSIDAFNKESKALSKLDRGSYKRVKHDTVTIQHKQEKMIERGHAKALVKHNPKLRAKQASKGLLHTTMIALGVREAHKVAQRNAAIREQVAEHIGQNEALRPSEQKLMEHVQKHLDMGASREDALREMHRTAHQLSRVSHMVKEVHDINNGIRLTPRGEELLRKMGIEVHDIMAYARMGEDIGHRNINVNTERAATLQIDSLLQRGREVMIKAKVEQYELRRSLTKEQEMALNRGRDRDDGYGYC